MLSCHTEQPGNDEFLCRMNHEGGQHTCHLLPGQGRHRTELSWGGLWRRRALETVWFSDLQAITFLALA